MFSISFNRKRSESVAECDVDSLQSAISSLARYVRGGVLFFPLPLTANDTWQVRRCKASDFLSINLSQRKSKVARKD